MLWKKNVIAYLRNYINHLFSNVVTYTVMSLMFKFNVYSYFYRDSSNWVQTYLFGQLTYSVQKIVISFLL